ncbi:VOC family protein [Bifidobacterium sp.]|jgi:catechol 2,3-dioxygenase-like lactoylglutathione lyase family enzyme|uniref:VOC family protein n=1 Tax=Bifidobacterium sp. TaxID=41200 RepID=UPI0025C59B7B|nr:VOC family protein [Bifidobacterium sp.]MCH4208803.1 VOC family protein [Bifidobacterium sp.]MCI1224761.1 VOC family protein [Bifidobacterium sp.]
MIDHVTVYVRDLGKSGRFYARLLQPLGYQRNLTMRDAMSFRQGDGPSADPGGDFWISCTQDSFKPTHIAFHATDASQVRAFHAAGLAAGGTDHGTPGPRQYHRGYYAAFVLDPDGNNIEAVIHDYVPPISKAAAPDAAASA